MKLSSETAKGLGNYNDLDWPRTNLARVSAPRPEPSPAKAGRWTSAPKAKIRNLPALGHPLRETQ